MNILIRKNLSELQSKLLFILISVNLIIGQEIPPTFYENQLKKIYIDSGKDWMENSTFGPIRRKADKNKSKNLKVISRLGSILSSQYKTFYAYAHFTYQNKFHGYLYPRIVDEPDKIIGFSGIPRDIRRKGFSSGETDMSGICFENYWMILQFGRGRQSWGAGNGIQLAIGEESNAYDYGLLDLNFKNIRARYFHGFLETRLPSTNRYITGRGIEWSNRKNFIVALSEIVVYSGENRAIDFSYFNPISTHLEIELNNRQNRLGTDSGNGVWQISIDKMFFGKIRLSGNYLFDEFILDDQQIRDGKSNGVAFSFKGNYTLLSTSNSMLSIHASQINIGTNTFKHENGNNNFAHRNQPLGYPKGNDSREKEVGFNWLYKNKFILKATIRVLDIGEKNSLNDIYSPYISYSSSGIPSGATERTNHFFCKAQWWIKPHISIFSELHHSNFEEEVKSFFNIGFNAYYEMSGLTK